MCQSSKKEFFKKFLYEPLPVEVSRYFLFISTSVCLYPLFVFFCLFYFLFVFTFCLSVLSVCLFFLFVFTLHLSLFSDWQYFLFVFNFCLSSLSVCLYFLFVCTYCLSVLSVCWYFLFNFVCFLSVSESFGSLSTRSLQCRGGDKDHWEQAGCCGLSYMDLPVPKDDPKPQLLQPAR